MCEALCTELLSDLDWQPSKRRLRCISYIINIVIQAFFFAKNKEAFKLVIQQAAESLRYVDDELLLLLKKDDTAS